MNPLSAMTRLTGSRKTTSSAITKMTVANTARCAAPLHVGGLFRRSSRRSCALCRDLVLRSSGVGLRPVRPRDSMAPAALPRCLVLRLRFVWAMSVRAYDLFDRAAVADRDVVREAVERGCGCQPD